MAEDAQPKEMAEDAEPKPAKRGKRSIAFAPIDLVEDRMRSRLVSVAIMFCMYLVIGSEFLLYQNPSIYELVGKVSFSSQLPSITDIGPNLTADLQQQPRPAGVLVVSNLGVAFHERRCSRSPRGYIDAATCASDPGYREPVAVSTSVNRITYASVPRNTLDCRNGPGEARAPALINTLPNMMIDAACTPVLAGATAHVSADTGTASFDELRVVSGPAAMYTFQFKTFDLPPGSEIFAQSILTGRVGEIRIEVGPPARLQVTVGEPFSVQPSVFVSDAVGNPVAGAVVTAFASEYPNFYQAWVPEEQKSSKDDGAVLHHVRGQCYALLGGVTSSVTGADGIASWHNLSVTAAASKYLYLFFFSEGAVASWSDADLKLPLPGRTTRPPRYVAPVYVYSPVESVVQLAATGLDALGCPADDEPVSATSSHWKIAEGPPMDAEASTSFPYAQRVRVTDAAGNPVAGVVVLAILHTARGYQLPLLARPENWRLKSVRSDLNIPEAKQLHNAASEPSDADGVAVFPSLYFGSRGEPDVSVNTLEHFESDRVHRIAFCTAGGWGAAADPTLLEGCALSCPVAVVSRVAAIEWSAQPEVLRSSRAPDNALMAGERLDTLPATPAVRMLDNDGNPIGGKKPVVSVIDTAFFFSICEQFLAPAGITQPEDVSFATIAAAGREAYTCLITTLEVVNREYVSLTLAYQEGEKALTGDNGFLTLPVRYNTIPSWSLSHVANASARGTLRLIATDDEPAKASVFSVLSDPFTVSFPGDYDSASSQDTQCTKLTIVNKFGSSLMYVGEDMPQAVSLIFDKSVSNRPRRPSATGGWRSKNAWNASFGTSMLYGHETTFEDFDSWILPPDLGLSISQSADTRGVGSEAQETILSKAACFNEMNCDGIDQNEWWCAFLNERRYNLTGAPTNVSAIKKDCDLLKAACNHSTASAAEYIDCAASHYFDKSAGLQSHWTDSTGLRDERQPDDVGWTTPLPVIRLWASDESGNPVAGLRVRLNVLNAQYPHLPQMGWVVSCGLRYSDPSHPNYEDEVLLQAEGFGTTGMPAGGPSSSTPCVTDEWGYVDMVLRDYNLASHMGEFIQTAPTGGLRFEYTAYKLVTDAAAAAGKKLVRACSAGPFELDVASRVASVSWAFDTHATDLHDIGTQFGDYQRTSINLMLDGGVPEVEPAADAPKVLSPAFTVYPAIDIGQLAGAAGAQFRVRDDSGNGLTGKTGVTKFVQLPSYLPGWTTTTASCNTFLSYDNGSRLSPMSEELPCRLPFLDMYKFTDYGFKPASGLMMSYPVEPFMTMTSMETAATGGHDGMVQEDGVGLIFPSPHSGHPGLYGVVAEVEGVRSSPLIFHVPNRLKTIEITGQPNGYEGQLDDDGRSIWEVGGWLAETPLLRMLDADGLPLQGYQASVRAVDPTSGEIVDDIAFDVRDGILESVDSGYPLFSPVGSARSSPADFNGEATFWYLVLLDAPPGVAFQLQFYFEPAPAEWEKQIYDYAQQVLDTTFDIEPVVSTASTVFVSKLGVRLSATSMGSDDVALGKPLPEVPQLRYEHDLEQFEFNNETLWRIPHSVEIGLGGWQLVPVQSGGAAVMEPRDTAAAVLARNRCVFAAGELFAGSCTVSEDTTATGVPALSILTGGKVVGGLDVTNETALQAHPWYCKDYTMGPLEEGMCFRKTGVATPSFVVSVSFPELIWSKALSDGAGTLQLGAVTETYDGYGPTAKFNQMKAASQAASIVLFSEPPEQVTVGRAFLMKARVRIASGAYLTGARVEATVVPATGNTVSPASFVSEQFSGLQLPTASNAEVALDEESSTAVSDLYGICRFVVEVASGEDGAQFALVLVGASGSVSSARTRPITLRSPIAAVTSTNVSTDAVSRRGADGVGKPGNAFFISEEEDYPIEVALTPNGGQLDLTLDLRSDFEATAADFAPRLAASACEPMSTCWRVYEQKQVDDIIRAQNATASLDAASTDLQADAGGAAAAAVNGTISSGATNVSGLAAGASAAFFAYLDSSISMTSAEAALPSMVSLLTSGSAPQAEVTMTSTATLLTNYGVTVLSDTTLAFHNLTLEVRAPGKYYLQPLVAGIAAGDVHHLVGPIIIENYDSRTPEAIATERAIGILTSLIVCTLAIGASDWHNPKYGIPVGLIGTFVLLMIFRKTHPIKGFDTIGIWYCLTFSILIAGTVQSLIGLLVGRRVPRLKPFSETRRECYFQYVADLWNRPDRSRQRLRDEQTKAWNLVAPPSADLGRLLYLEKELKELERNEFGWKTQAKELIGGVKNPAKGAFFYPARMYGTFVVSIFATGFMMKGVLRTLRALQARVKVADITTITTIYDMLTLTQRQYELRSGEDLPSLGTDWAMLNAETLHKYMLGLSDAILTASTIGCTFGFLAYFAAWVTLLIDFRAKVMQARRGIYDFNVRKTKLLFSWTYFGTQVSNGLITFILISFIVTFIALIFTWNLTMDMLKWFIREKWRWLLVFLAPILINIVTNKLCKGVLGKLKTIKLRYAWMAYDMYQILLSSIAGLTKALVRFVLVVVIALVSLPRTDVSIFPAWVEVYLQLDSGAKSYRGLVLLYHHHNNPVMRVAAWLLQESAKARRDEAMREQLGLAPPEKLRAINRWQKALFLVRNPELAQFSGKGHEPCDMVKLNKELKASKKEIKKQLAVAVVHPPPTVVYYPPPKAAKGSVAPAKVDLDVAPS